MRGELPMLSTDDEFQKIREGIEASADVLGGAIERHGGGSWDYMIVAVPVNRGIKEVGLMTSVPSTQLPHFLAYLLAQYRACAAHGRVIDDRTEGMKPS